MCMVSAPTYGSRIISRASASFSHCFTLNKVHSFVLPVAVRLADVCPSTAHCVASVAHSVCSSDTCVCQMGYLSHAARPQCTRLRIGDNCTNNAACALTIDYGTCVNGTCACADSYHSHEGDVSACRSTILDSRCAPHDACTNVIAHRTCSQRGRCVCEMGYRASPADTCLPTSDAIITASVVAAVCLLAFASVVVAVMYQNYQKTSSYAPNKYKHMHKGTRACTELCTDM